LQLRSVLDDIDVEAIKTGMLANADIVRTVARTLKLIPPSRRPPLVLDPVCVSTSGHTLLDSKDGALDALTEELFPLATVLTPNTTEAEELILRQRHDKGHFSPAKAATMRAMARITTIEDMLDASSKLCSFGPRAVLLKGGHLPQVAYGRHLHIADVEDVVDNIVTVADNSQFGIYSLTMECEGLVPYDANMEILFQAAAQDPAVRDVPVVVDVLCEVISGGGRGNGEEKYTLFVRPYLDSTSTHGTGCTLSAALACALAHGKPRTHFSHPVVLGRAPRSFSLFLFLCMSHATVIEAVRLATMYTYHGIATAFPMGSGHGPLNHMHSLLPRMLQRLV
jgi:hydroxymethylpyrimidine/phosphomethylpyrimidine kinase